MEKLEEATITITTAAEHYVAALTRGKTTGQTEEYERVITLLKKHGHYSSVLLLKAHKKTGL